MKMISVKSQTPTSLLSGGFFYQGFGEFEKVTNVVLSHDVDARLNPGIGLTTVSGYTAVAYPVIVSGNVVRVNIEKTLLSGGGTIVAASNDCISNTFTMIAYGE